VESSDVSIRGVLIFVGTLLVTALVIHFALYFMEWHFKNRELRRKGPGAQPQVRSSVARALPAFPEPRLQVSPPADLDTFRAREEEALASYGWVNKSSGIVRVPIQRAMEIIAQKGLPPADTNANAKPRSALDLIKERSQKK
jgi:hypothetical protein